MNENLALWHQVEKTDPSHTKPITGKAYQGNSPKPHYIVLKATEAFGPCGIGWGFEIVEEKLLDGALLEPGFYERIHMARVRVWYEWNGKRGSVEHVGQTVFSGKRANGKPFTDEDAPKKSVTDGLVKALSMIGFAGDIFLGRYDDSKYVSDLRREMVEAEKPKSSAQAKRDGDWQKIEAEVDSIEDTPTAFLWIKANLTRISGLPQTWREQARELWCRKVLSDCASERELRQFSTEYQADVESLPEEWTARLREVWKEMARGFRVAEERRAQLEAAE